MTREERERIRLHMSRRLRPCTTAAGMAANILAQCPGTAAVLFDEGIAAHVVAIDVWGGDAVEVLHEIARIRPAGLSVDVRPHRGGWKWLVPLRFSRRPQLGQTVYMHRSRFWHGSALGRWVLGLVARVRVGGGLGRVVALDLSSEVDA